VQCERDGVQCERDGMQCERDGVQCERDGMQCERDGVQCERDGMQCERDGVQCERDGVQCERDGVQCERDGVQCERDGVQCERSIRWQGRRMIRHRFIEIGTNEHIREQRSNAITWNPSVSGVPTGSTLMYISAGWFSLQGRRKRRRADESGEGFRERR
jgi:hypothetical protein